MERRIIVEAKGGLHARPAALFVKAAAAASHPVFIATDSTGAVQANSILAIMGLGVNYGQMVTLTCEDAGLLDTLEDLLMNPDL
jgi:phosphocarrier protein